MSKEFYTLKIGGIERQLQKFPVSDTLDIAAFILFGDVELTEVCARELLKKVPEFDYIVTPEAKSIPLAYEMSRMSGKKYIVVRKGVKVYMDRPEKVADISLTTQKEQALYLGHEASICKRVCCKNVKVLFLYLFVNGRDTYVSRKLFNCINCSLSVFLL